MTKLNSIYNFCTQPQCRHKVLANYFGQDYSDSQCGACDYCLNELNMVKDAISVGQKVLYCVDAVRQGDYGFGAGYVTNILKGKLTERIESMDHDSLSTFAIMADESESFIRHIIEQLVGQGFLDKDENFSTLSVTGTGNMLLQGKASLVLAKPLIASKKKESKRKAAKRKVSEWADVDEDLFQLLREKRAEISQSKGVPAYIIFSDKTLIDMATKKPLTHEAFSELYGVGEKKLKPTPTYS